MMLPEQTEPECVVRWRLVRCTISGHGGDHCLEFIAPEDITLGIPTVTHGQNARTSQR